jgi:hypothetical protein
LPILLSQDISKNSDGAFVPAVEYAARRSGNAFWRERVERPVESAAAGNKAHEAKPKSNLDISNKGKDPKGSTSTNSSSRIMSHGKGNLLIGLEDNTAFKF